MEQSSHGRRDIRADNQVDQDLAKIPTKPTLNGYAFIYPSQGHNMHVNLDELPWEQSQAWLFNPRNGKVTRIKRIPNSGNHTFEPPDNPGGENDFRYFHNIKIEIKEWI